MKVLSLFSGGGLGDYGLTLAGMEIIGQVEIDEYCQKILKLRWPDVPKWRDINNVRGEEVIKTIGKPDLISGGFPCQDISNAGNKDGISGEKSGLWKEMLRIIREIRPKFCLVENVSALLGRGLGVVLGDLASSGYDSEWECISADSFNAPHPRNRIWIVGYTDLPRCEGTDVLLKTRSGSLRSGEGVERKSSEAITPRIFTSFERQDEWTPEPQLGRVAHGVANRVDRLKLLGNGQVVQVVQWIGERIMEYERKV